MLTLIRVVNCYHRPKPNFSPTSCLMSCGCTCWLLICCLSRASCACAKYTKPTGPGSPKPLTVGPFMNTPNCGQLNNNFHISFQKLLLQYGCHDLLCQIWAGLFRMQSLCVHKNCTSIDIVIYNAACTLWSGCNKTTVSTEAAAVLNCER